MAKCTVVGLRKCKDCCYFDDTKPVGWCCWKGRSRKRESTECDDGWSERKK